MDHRYTPRHFPRIVLCFSILLTTLCFAEVRDWTSRKGKTVRGELVEITGENVKLKSAKTGKVYTLSIDSLSGKDQAYVRAVEAVQEQKQAASDTPAAPDADRTIDIGSSPHATGTPDLEQLTGIKINPIVLIILAVLNVPIYFLLGKCMFDDWAGFLECMKYWVTPDSWSFFKGEALDDWFAEMKLFIWMAGCIGAVLGEYYLLAKYVL